MSNADVAVTVLISALIGALPPGGAWLSAVLVPKIPPDKPRMLLAAVIAVGLSLVSLPMGFVSGWLMVGDGRGWGFETQLLGGMMLGVPILTLVGSGVLLWRSRRTAS